MTRFSAHSNEPRFYNPTGSFDWATVSLPSRTLLHEVFCRNYKRTIHCYELQKYKNLNHPCAQGLRYQKTIRMSGPVPVAARSKAWFYGPSFAGIAVPNPAGAWMLVCCECCVLSGRGPWVGLITHTEQSYRLCCFWVWSWSLNNEKALAHWGLLGHGKRNRDVKIRVYILEPVSRWRER